jgi:hypothetical protein
MQRAIVAAMRVLLVVDLAAALESAAAAVDSVAVVAADSMAAAVATEAADTGKLLFKVDQSPISRAACGRWDFWRGDTYGDTYYVRPGRV